MIFVFAAAREAVVAVDLALEVRVERDNCRMVCSENALPAGMRFSAATLRGRRESVRHSFRQVDHPFSLDSDRVRGDGSN